jgi:hypothetical protein
MVAKRLKNNRWNNDPFKAIHAANLVLEVVPKKAKNH